MTTVTENKAKINFLQFMNGPDGDEEMSWIPFALSDFGVDFAFDLSDLMDDPDDPDDTDTELFCQLGDRLERYGKWIQSKAVSYNYLHDEGFEAIYSSSNFRGACTVKCDGKSVPVKWCRREDLVFVQADGDLDATMGLTRGRMRERDRWDRQTAARLIAGLTKKTGYDINCERLASKLKPSPADGQIIEF